MLTFPKVITKVIVLLTFPKVITKVIVLLTFPKVITKVIVLLTFPKVITKVMIDCICRKISAINSFIDPDFIFKYDKATGIIYVVYRGDCIYLKELPEPLFNTLLQREIINASALMLEVGYMRIQLTCNGGVYILHKIDRISSGRDQQYFPPYCIHPIKHKLYMGVPSDAMFIGDKIYHSYAGCYGLFEINNSIIVSLTNNGPEILEGLKTTMSTEGHEKFTSDETLQPADFCAYGLTFDKPDSKGRFPLFSPIIPLNVWENNMGQLVVDGDTFNDEMRFKRIKFHKNEDWPIEIIRADGGSERFNIIEARQLQKLDSGYCVYGYIPHLVNRQNIAIPFGDSYYPRNNKYGEIENVEFSCDMFSTTLSEKTIISMYKDCAENYYGRIREKDYIFNLATDSYLEHNIFTTFYLKNAKPMRTKPALRE